MSETASPHQALVPRLFGAPPTNGSIVSELGATASSLAADGFRVLPVRPNGKVPLTQHGCKNASNDRNIIEEWWRCWPDANVGIASGIGLFDVDIDVKNGVEGEATWRDLQQQKVWRR